MKERHDLAAAGRALSEFDSAFVEKARARSREVMRVDGPVCKRPRAIGRTGLELASGGSRMFHKNLQRDPHRVLDPLFLREHGLISKPRFTATPPGSYRSTGNGWPPLPGKEGEKGSVSG